MSRSEFWCCTEDKEDAARLKKPHAGSRMHSTQENNRKCTINRGVVVCREKSSWLGPTPVWQAHILSAHTSQPWYHSVHEERGSKALPLFHDASSVIILCRSDCDLSIPPVQSHCLQIITSATPVQPHNLKEGFGPATTSAWDRRESSSFSLSFVELTRVKSSQCLYLSLCSSDITRSTRRAQLCWVRKHTLFRVESRFRWYYPACHIIPTLWLLYRWQIKDADATL